MRYIFLLTVFLIWSNSSFSDDKLIKVDFDKSMGVENYPQYKLMMRHQDGKKILDFYRDLFNKNFYSSQNNQSQIPKIIHQIWIGPRPVPEIYKKYAEGCKKLHPDWEYKLWTQEELNAENFPTKYMKLFEDMQYRYSGKKDIIEFFLLYKYGGVVMDMDFECIKPFDSITENHDFFASLEPGVYWSDIPVMTNAIIGSIPDNVLFLETLDKAIRMHDADYTKYNTGIRFFIRKMKSVFTHERGIKVSDSRRIFLLNFAENFRKNNSFYTNPIIFPATYFNPVFPFQNKKYSVVDKIKVWLGLENGDNYFIKVRPETIAIQDFYD
ncbi:MAG: glycosyltransferase [Rickettsiales bacterium]